MILCSGTSSLFKESCSALFFNAWATGFADIHRRADIHHSYLGLSCVMIAAPVWAGLAKRASSIDTSLCIIRDDNRTFGIRTRNSSPIARFSRLGQSGKARQARNYDRNSRFEIRKQRCWKSLASFGGSFNGA